MHNSHQVKVTIIQSLRTRNRVLSVTIIAEITHSLYVCGCLCYLLHFTLMMQSCTILLIMLISEINRYCMHVNEDLELILTVWISFF